MFLAVRKVTLVGILVLAAYMLAGQVGFSTSEAYFPTKSYRSGIPTAIVDVNNDGRDDLVRVTYRGILEVYLSSANQDKFYKIEYEAALPDVPWSITVGNLDNEGPNEIALGTVYRGGFIFKLNLRNERLELKEVTARDFYSQGANLVDINGDGFVDWFINDDEAINDIFLNDNGGEMVDADDFIDMSTAIESDNSGNYSTAWFDIDGDGDLDFYQSKCRSGALSNKDPRRVNQLFINDGNNNFSDKASEFGIDFGSQTWASNFGDLDNDGDLDAIVINHIDRWNLIENVKNDTFVERNSRIDSASGFANQCLLRDFDNNGYLDILVTGVNDYLWYNQGNWSFTLDRDPFLYFSATNFSVGDINRDGFLDIYSAYSEGFNDKGYVDDALYINDTNDNNWIGFHLVGTESNKSGIGAKVKLYSPSIGAQMRTVSSGESYGMMNSLNQIFGLGQDAMVDSVKVIWPSGKEDLYTNLNVGSYYKISEGVCIEQEKSLALDNEGIICKDESINLAAPAGYKYTWSNGDTSEIVNIDRWGYYQVEASKDDCAQNIPGVIINPNRTANFNQLIFNQGQALCVKDAVTLNAVPARNYKWSTGDENQQIEINSSGVYELVLEDYCGNTYEDEISIQFLDAEPIVQGDTVISVNGVVEEDAILTANGNNIKWYLTPTEDKAIAEGDTLIVPNLEQSTTFYVSSESSSSFSPETIGEISWRGFNKYNGATVNGRLFFHVQEPCVIESIDLMTDTIGTRVIQVFNQVDDIVFEKSVDLLAGDTTIEINLSLDPGVDYYMTTDANANLENFGFKSPFLIRSNENISYPYKDSDLLWITNSSFGPKSYPYFYNWQVRKQSVDCVTERVPVLAFVDVRDNTLEASSDLFNIYPNPAENILYIENIVSKPFSQIFIYDALGRRVKSYVNLDAESTELNISDLFAGQYFVKILSQESVSYSYRFIKQ